MKTLRIIFLIILTVSMLTLLTGIIISHFYSDKIIQYAVNEINKQIKAEIQVEKVNFSFLRKFPDATVRFSGVLIRSVPEFDSHQFGSFNTDTLLFVKNVFVQFDIPGLIRNKYVVRDIHIDGGRINLFIDKSGNVNYKFWKEQQSKETSDFSLELKSLRITNIELRQYNMAIHSEINGFIDRMDLKGNFSNIDYQLNFSLNGRVNNYTIAEIPYLTNKSLSIQSVMQVVGNEYIIETGRINIEDISLSLLGKITSALETRVDLKISVKDLNIKSLLEYLPLVDPMLNNKIRAAGRLNLQASVNGLISNTIMPEVSAVFSVNDGIFINIPNDITIEDIQLEGYYTNGVSRNPSTTEIKLNNFLIKYFNSYLKGQINIKNLVHPEIYHSLEAEIDMEDLDKIIKDGKFEYASGSAKIQMNLSGNHVSFQKFSKEDLLKLNYAGKVMLNNVQLKLKDHIFDFELIDGEIDINKYLIFDNLNLIISGNNFNVKGRIDNLPEYLLTSTGNLWANLDIYSDKVILDSNYFEQFNRGQEDTALVNVLPEHLYIKSRFWLDYFRYRNFEASQIKGDMIYTPGILSFNSIVFEAMEGNVIAEGFLARKAGNEYLFKISSTLKNIMIRPLFYSFNNFGQNYIIDQNLMGNLDGNVDFSAEMDPDFRIKMETILTETDVEINNGKLIRFEPMLGLSKFIEVEELENITFSTLNNQILIRNSEVVIPKMDINSSAFNIAASGIHGFDNHFSYKVTVDLSEVLSKKARKRVKTDEEFGEIIDDGLGRTRLYLSIEGTPDDYKIKYDRKGAVDALRGKMDVEKQELKSILKEEFGFFREDTTTFKESKDTDQPFFTLEWEEEDQPAADSAKVKKGKKEQFIIEWDENENKKDTVTNRRNRKK